MLFHAICFLLKSFSTDLSLIHRIRCYNPLCQNPRKKTYSEAPAQTNLASTLATSLPTNGEKQCKYSECLHRVAMTSSRSALEWTGNRTSHCDWQPSISTSLCLRPGPIRRFPSSMWSKSTLPEQALRVPLVGNNRWRAMQFYIDFINTISPLVSVGLFIK